MINFSVTNCSTVCIGMHKLEITISQTQYFHTIVLKLNYIVLKLMLFYLKESAFARMSMNIKGILLLLLLFHFKFYRAQYKAFK